MSDNKERLSESTRHSLIHVIFFSFGNSKVLFYILNLKNVEIISVLEGLLGLEHITNVRDIGQLQCISRDNTSLPKQIQRFSPNTVTFSTAFICCIFRTVHFRSPSSPPHRVTWPTICTKTCDHCQPVDH